MKELKYNPSDRLVGGLLKTSRWELLYSEKKNGDGAGLLNAPIVGIVIAVDLDNIENYIIYAFVKDKAGTMESGEANRIVLSNNKLSLGATNDQGTSVINGGTNVKQYMIGLGID